MEYKPMEKRTLSIAVLLVGILSVSAFLIFAQDDNTRLHVVVNLVQLNVAVTDGKGNYVTSLRPSDFAVSEDGIAESIATFEEGNGHHQIGRTHRRGRQAGCRRRCLSA